MVGSLKERQDKWCQWQLSNGIGCNLAVELTDLLGFISIPYLTHQLLCQTKRQTDIILEELTKIEPTTPRIAYYLISFKFEFDTI